MCISLHHVKCHKAVPNKDHIINLHSNIQIKALLPVQLEIWGKVSYYKLHNSEKKAQNLLLCWVCITLTSMTLFTCTQKQMLSVIDSGQPKTHFLLLLPTSLQTDIKASEETKYPRRPCGHIFPSGNLPLLKLIELLTSKSKQ